MKAVVQRVNDARVEVDGRIVGSIGKGLLVYLGVGRGDEEKDVDLLVRKISKLRIFRDENDKMNLCIQDIAGGAVLVVSQFTLLADLSKGNRPSFDNAAARETAQRLYKLFKERLAAEGIRVASGVFGAHMHVFYENDGPVTIIYDTKTEKKI